MNKEISKEEAIEILAEQRCFKSGKIRQAYDMAIEALEQKPSGEGGKSALSKEETIRLIKGRIMDEHYKHTSLDWAEIAACKLYSQWSEFFQPPVISDEDIEIIASNQNSERDRNIFSEGMKAMRKLLTNK